MTTKKYPSPEEIQAAGLDITHYTNRADFQKAGGSTKQPWPSTAGPPRYIVSAQSAGYLGEEGGIENAIDAMDGFLDLFNEGGWTVFAWDNVENEGWSWPAFGPNWIDENFADLTVTKPSPKPPRSAPSSNRALSVINRHRATIGMGPLDPVSAGYSTDELERMARSIEDTGTMANPRKTKARLMR